MAGTWRQIDQALQAEHDERRRPRAATATTRRRRARTSAPSRNGVAATAQDDEPHRRQARRDRPPLHPGVAEEAHLHRSPGARTRAGRPARHPARRSRAQPSRRPTAYSAVVGRVTRRTPSTRLEVTPEGVATHDRDPTRSRSRSRWRSASAGRSVAVTMRTPGDDFDLALGYLVTEGVIAARRRRGRPHALPRRGRGRLPHLQRRRRHPRPPAPCPTSRARERSAPVSSACGVCGKTSIDAVTHPQPVCRGRRPAAAVDRPWPWACPTCCARSRRRSTGPAACTPPGSSPPTARLLVVREDVGRHNAVDKVVGWAAREGRLPLAGHVLVRQRTGQLRAGAEGRDGRAAGARGGVGALVAGRRAGRRPRASPSSASPGRRG